jgi:hypothetical protein
MKIAPFLLIILLFIPTAIQAKYQYQETVYIPLPKSAIQKWKLGYQKANENGAAVTRYILESETIEYWTQMLNIQFKDRKLIKGATAKEEMENENAKSKWVTTKIHTDLPNDLIYERSFPSGEHEIVRLIMTKNGIHRAAYIKRGPLPQEEKNRWIELLSLGTVGGK